MDIMYQHQPRGEADVLAELAAIAIQNARLYQQRAQRENELRTLLEINKTLGQVHELPTLLNAIAAEAARLLAVPEVIVRLREGDELRLEGGWTQPGAGRNNRSLRIGESLSGRVAVTGEPWIVND